MAEGAQAWRGSGQECGPDRAKTLVVLVLLTLLLLGEVSGSGPQFGTDWSAFEGVLPSKTRGDNGQRYPPRLNGTGPTPLCVSGDKDRGENLTLLVSITSAASQVALREAIRQTWALPCMASPACEYRFFVDIMNVTEAYAAILHENNTYGDIVIRGTYCPHMEERHTFPALNYGNTFKRPWVYGGGGVPYYHFRGLYKLDWKICHSKWAYAMNRLALYHVYTEDDSYLCMENLLHQFLHLRSLNVPPNMRNWRMGDPKWDGYDDNLSFLTQDIVRAFALHYPEPGFNCSKLADDGNPAPKVHLTWGNSFMSRACDWRNALQQHCNLTYSTPWLWTRVFQCPGLAPLPLTVNTTSRPSPVPTAAPTLPANSTRLKIDLLCPATASTIHNHDAGRFVRYEKHIEHYCEFNFVVHKVSDVDIRFLWDNVTGHDYHNLTAVFLNDGTGGWHEILHTIARKEETCHTAANVTDCLRW